MYLNERQILGFRLIKTKRQLPDDDGTNYNNMWRKIFPNLNYVKNITSDLANIQTEKEEVTTAAVLSAWETDQPVDLRFKLVNLLTSKFD